MFICGRKFSICLFGLDGIYQNFELAILCSKESTVGAVRICGKLGPPMLCNLAISCFIPSTYNVNYIFNVVGGKQNFICFLENSTYSYQTMHS